MVNRERFNRNSLIPFMHLILSWCLESPDMNEECGALVQNHDWLIILLNTVDFTSKRTSKCWLRINASYPKYCINQLVNKNILIEKLQLQGLRKCTNCDSPLTTGIAIKGSNVVES